MKDRIARGLAAYANSAEGIATAGGALKADLPQVTLRASGGDDLGQINTALASLKASGGGVLRLAYSGGFQISDTVTVDFSNCLIQLNDSVTLTKTTKASAFVFTGDSVSQRISDVGIVGIGPAQMVDGNGRNMTGYTYDTADTFYSSVLFKWCDNWLVYNIHAYSGLVNCIRAYQCGFGVDQDCNGVGALYDNGHTIDFDPNPPAWSDTDPSTWSNARLVRPRAWNNAGFGIASYAATGVTIDSLKSWANGTDLLGFPMRGGGFSVEADYFGGGGTRGGRNHRCTIISPQVDSCNSTSAWITGAGTQIIGGNLRGPIAPVNNTDPIGIFGCNIVVLASGSLRATGLNLVNAGRHNVTMLADTTFPSLDFDGTMDGSVRHGIFARGIDRLTVSPRSKILNSGQSGTYYGVSVDNTGAAYNAGSGSVDVAGLIENSAGRAVSVTNVANLAIPNLRLKNNRAIVATRGVPITVDTTSHVQVGTVFNQDDNAYTTYIVDIATSVTTAVVNNASGSFTVGAFRNQATTKQIVYSDSGQPVPGLTLISNVGATLTPGVSTFYQRYSGAITEDRNITLSTTGASDGDAFLIQRGPSATGAFNVNIGSGPLFRLNQANQAVQVVYSAAAAAWIVVDPNSLPATTASIGGSVLTAGQTATGTVAVFGALVGNTAVATPNTYPGAGFIWDAYVSSAGNVTVVVTCIAAGTPTASTYNVRVIP